MELVIAAEPSGFKIRVAAYILTYSCCLGSWTSPVSQLSTDIVTVETWRLNCSDTNQQLSTIKENLKVLLIGNCDFLSLNVSIYNL